MDADVAITIAVLLQSWLADSKDRLKKSTYRIYEHYALDILCPSIGQLPAAEFGEEQLTAFLKTAKEDNCSGSKLTENTSATVESIIRAAYRYGMDRHLVPKSYFGSYQGKKRVKKPLDILEMQDINKLRSRLEYLEPQRRLEVYIPLYTGIENGELCALKWKDIEMETGFLQINRKLQRLKAEDSLKATSVECMEYGEKGGRKVRMSRTLQGVLNDIITSGQRISGGERFVLTGTGKYLDERTYQLHLTELAELLNIPKLGAKTLRDTFAVMCLQAGGDIYSVACLMGMALGSADIRYHDYLTVNDDFLAGL